MGLQELRLAPRQRGGTRSEVCLCCGFGRIDGDDVGCGGCGGVGQEMVQANLLENRARCAASPCRRHHLLEMAGAGGSVQWQEWAVSSCQVRSSLMTRWV